MKISTNILIITLIVFGFLFFISAAKAAINVTGTIDAGGLPATTGKLFQINVTAHIDSPNVINSMHIYSSSGKSIDKHCPSSSQDCTYTWVVSEDNPGTYTYQVSVNTSDGGKGISDVVTVDVTGPSLSPPPSAPPSAPPSGGSSECLDGQICNPLSTDSFEDLLSSITNFIFTIALALAPVMMIIAGFMFVTSAGDPGRVGTAKKLALYTLIGLAIILLASGLIKVLQSVLGVTTP